MYYGLITALLGNPPLNCLLPHNFVSTHLKWDAPIKPRPEFVLGGLALTRLEVLKKHNMWADSTNWLWWSDRYNDYDET